MLNQSLIYIDDSTRYTKLRLFVCKGALKFVWVQNNMMHFALYTWHCTMCIVARLYMYTSYNYTQFICLLVLLKEEKQKKKRQTENHFERNFRRALRNGTELWIFKLLDCFLNWRKVVDLLMKHFLVTRCQGLFLKIKIRMCVWD